MYYLLEVTLVRMYYSYNIHSIHTFVVSLIAILEISLSGAMIFYCKQPRFNLS